MNDMELAEEIGGMIFDAIKHGDEKHQAWLHDKSHELAPQIIAALRRGHERPPSGEMVMVPREPTRKMLNAAFKSIGGDLSIHGNAGLSEIYRAMLSAAEAEGRKS